MSDSDKWLRIRVTDLTTGKPKTNVKIPASLANFGMRMAARFAPNDVQGLDMDEIIAVMQSGGDAKLVDVEDEEKGERIEVYFE